MNDSACFAAVAFNSSGYIAAVTSADYDFAVKTSRYYRNVCKYPSARVVTAEQLDTLLDEEWRRRDRGE
jgi:hypothetical protein